MFWLKKDSIFLDKKKPLRSAEVLCYVLKINYNSVSAEGSGIIQDILQTVNFIFFCYLIVQMCEQFLNQPNKKQINFYYPIKIVYYVKFFFIKIKKLKFNLQIKMVLYFCTRIQRKNLN
ncbi:hypothetical protein DMB68_11890 [Flavobacterium hydrophilum]|uniref:Uncharacterized protein n=1 Tax=Flavobacterium hydrophilum TaxID=2211445 RepID=A0A2V4C223_9FLAO|nr:hypothetical protein DMB68_11890 [Flavobacterium hydrophilum]